jgi:putative membrane protein
MTRFNDKIFLFLKGMAMGAADVVPGVSGGTIAFISGIYETLLDSIRSVNGKALQLLVKGQFKDFWMHINGNFLLLLISGIFASILSLSRLTVYLLEHQPILIWSFFFGLIIASIWGVSKQISRWNPGVILAFVLGTAVAYFITVTAPTQTPETWWFIMFSGAIAICAMILPGISGSFILLLLGKYKYILDAIKNFEIDVLMLFAVGCVTGLLSFSHLLNWLLKRYHNLAIAVLTGFMLGSLNKVWPWKMAVETYTDSHGKVQPILEKNLLPGEFALQTGQAHELGMALVLALVGFAAVWLLDRQGSKVNSELSA